MYFKNDQWVVNIHTHSAIEDFLSYQTSFSFEKKSPLLPHDPEGTRHELFSFFVNVFLHSRAFNIARCIGVEGDPELEIQCCMQQHSLCTLLFLRVITKRN